MLSTVGLFSKNEVSSSEWSPAVIDGRGALHSKTLADAPFVPVEAGVQTTPVNLVGEPST